MSPLLRSDLPGFTLLVRGKVRDVYEVRDALLIVTTDRISAFDYILPVAIPRKGEVLNRMSLFWFSQLLDLTPNHLITSSLEEFPAELHPFRDQLAGRSMLVRRAEMIPVECVARGYLSGSGWKEYQSDGTVCSIQLPSGLRQGDRLPYPIFTPATKSDSGHDENISFDHMAGIVGAGLAARLRQLTIALYNRAAAYAETRGIIIADTKFEFGQTGGELILADEVLTPDSSRFWPKDQWSPGGTQPSYDKQFVRDYLEEVQWNKQPPAPALPDDVVQRTSARYVEAFRLLTGTGL